METIKTVRTFFALGTANSILAFGSESERAVNAAIHRTAEIHNRMSVFQPDSDVFRLNEAAGRESVRIHPDTASLLLLAKKCARMTGGAFDITLRPLSSLWGIGKKGSFIPPAGEIKKALALAGTGDLVVDTKAGTARLARHGQSTDLGGLAKGYAGDEVRRILTEHGVQNALVNLGGNIVALGKNPAGVPWRVGVQNPLLPRGESLAALDAQNISVVTSGMGERFFMKGGRLYHHILDPRTGMPAKSGLLSATVLGRSGAVADALATALFILDPNEGLSLLRRDPEGFFSENGVQALLVSEDLSIIATPGLPGVAAPGSLKEAH